MLTGLPLALSPGPLVWVSADRPYPGYQRGTEVSTPTTPWTLPTAHLATLRVRSRPLSACGSGGGTEVGPQLLLQELEEEEGGKENRKVERTEHLRADSPLESPASQSDTYWEISKPC